MPVTTTLCRCVLLCVEEWEVGHERSLDDRVLAAEPVAVVVQTHSRDGSTAVSRAAESAGLRVPTHCLSACWLAFPFRSLLIRNSRVTEAAAIRRTRYLLFPQRPML